MGWTAAACQKGRGWSGRAAAVLAVAAVAGVTVVAGAGTGVAAAGTPAAAVTAHGWGQAAEVPGLGALNQGGNAGISAISCGAAGDCSAGGSYTDAGGHQNAYLADETQGSWQQATVVPGLAPLNQGASASLGALSCATADGCAAGGSYTDAGGHVEGFVVSRSGSSWGQAAQIPGLSQLNKGGSAGVGSMSCVSAGNCAAGGSYTNQTDHQQVFVVAEKNGSWGQAAQIPGLGQLDAGNGIGLGALSCGAAGNCSAGGYYTNGAGDRQGFVASETGGVWHKAVEVPGLGALNKYGMAGVTSVSCPAAGDCAAGGFYAGGCDCGGNPPAVPFVVSETSGNWGRAREIPDDPNAGDYGETTSVSCASAGNCTAGGFYSDGSQAGCCTQVFVDTETGGSWGNTQEVPGSGALGAGDGDSLAQVSCATDGACAAGGYYTGVSGDVDDAWVDSGSGGNWANAQEVPGTAALNQQNAFLNVVSCTGNGACGAGGTYTDAAGHTQVFVVSGKRSGGPR